jgi:hypothetical protein
MVIRDTPMPPMLYVQEVATHRAVFYIYNIIYYITIISKIVGPNVEFTSHVTRLVILLVFGRELDVKDSWRISKADPFHMTTPCI